VRVGPQWHADGSFERRVFSHVLFHAQAVPRVGGGTEMSHLAAAFDALPAAQREAAGRVRQRPRANISLLSPVTSFGRRGAGWRLSTPTPAPSTRSSTSTLAQATGRSLSTSARRAAAPERERKGGASVGAVVRWPTAPALPAPPLEAMDPAVAPSAAFGHRLLRRRSLRRLARQLEALLSSAAPAPQLPSLDERAPPHASP